MIGLHFAADSMGLSALSLLKFSGGLRKTLCYFCKSDVLAFQSHPRSSTPILGVLPLDQIFHVGVRPSINLKLISREIIFEVVQPTWSRHLKVTDGRTHRRTDNIPWHNRALRRPIASRGNNVRHLNSRLYKIHQHVLAKWVALKFLRVHLTAAWLQAVF